MKQLEKLLEIVNELANPKGISLEGITAKGIINEIAQEVKDKAAAKGK